MSVGFHAMGAAAAGVASKRLPVALLSLPPRAQAVLEFFFLSTGRNTFSAVAETAADAYIVDLDHLPSRQHWEEASARRALPTIALAIAPVDMPGITWVQKPATAAALLAAASVVMAQRNAAPVSPAQVQPKPVAAERQAVAPTEAAPSPAAALVPAPLAPVPAAASGPQPAGAAPAEPEETEQALPPQPAPRPPIDRSVDAATEARWCGTRDDIPAARISREEGLFIAPEFHLIGGIREANALARRMRLPALLEVPGLILVISQAENRIYASRPADDVKALCLAGRLPTSKVRSLTMNEYAEYRAERHGLTAIEPADRFVWELALETMQGRLPSGTSLQQDLFLKHWPNLTRLPLPPNALRVAALWATRGASLLETGRVLGIPQRHVFAFHAAASTLDLVTHDASHLRREEAAPQVAHKDRGLLSKLFGWLRGKR